MSSGRVLEELRQRETELHQVETRCNRKRLEALLHRDFTEFGRSGQQYDRQSIMDEFSRNEPGGPRLIFSRDFQVMKIGKDAALLTYRSARVYPDGRLHRHTNRSSLWIKTATGWQLRFHQGTPTDSFDRS